MDLLIEMLPNRSQPSVLTLNENGTPPTVSAHLPMKGQSRSGPTPAGVVEGLGCGVAEGEGETATAGPLPAIPLLADSRLLRTIATTTTAAAAIASLAEVFVPANGCAGHQERFTTERADRVDGSSVSVGKGGGPDRGDGLSPGCVLAVLASWWLRSSGLLPAGFPASPESEGLRT
ncbi:MAG TPA: hypothetical protein VJO36_06905 [Actinomycetota bacterium]|nr:hypothetical protein [Actinomycetota bacterium]